MSLEVVVNGQRLRTLLSGPPRITDQMDAACRTLELPVQDAYGLDNYLGQPVELWYEGKRWFFGILWRRRYTHTGAVSLLAYDPLIYFKRHKGDFYYQNMTYTQILRAMADRVGVWVGRMEETGAVLPPLFYRNTTGDRAAAEALSRTVKETGKKFWYRFNPYLEDFGLTLFERNQNPETLWSFQQGVNLTSAAYEENLESTYTAVTLVNRETGKTVTKVDDESALAFGYMVHFEEVDKDGAPLMEQTAQEKLEELSQVGVTMQVEGVNPNGIMPQLFSGDMVYVEEEYTQLIGAYHIFNVTHEFVSDKLVNVNMDVRLNPELPAIKYKRNALKDSTAKKPKKPRKKRGTDEGKGALEHPLMSDKLKAILEKAGDS